jgi:hypothetical protein
LGISTYSRPAPDVTVTQMGVEEYVVWRCFWLWYLQAL